MTIEKLDRLVRNKFTLHSPTLFPRPTVGGVVATGSHGTDFRSGNFTDHILEMKIVRPDGTLQTLERGHRDFRAAQVALGALGVVYSVKIELERQFNVYLDKRLIPLPYVLEEFDDLQKSCEFLELMSFPFSGSACVYSMDRTCSLPDRVQ